VTTRRVEQSTHVTARGHWPQRGARARQTVAAKSKRAQFNSTESIAIDNGSGKFLQVRIVPNIGEPTWTEMPLQHTCGVDVEQRLTSAMRKEPDRVGDVLSDTW